jgi:sugar O-acyltransferase (sialic acid O-acetyltransferase NeuD family)
MIIVGAGSAGKETSGIIKDTLSEEIIFFDENCSGFVWEKFPIINTYKELESILKINPAFCVAIGNPRLRKKMFEKLISLGGKPKNICAPDTTLLSNINENATIFQPRVSISYDVEVGESCMIHANSVIGHKVSIGYFVNISPLCSIIGPCKIGNETYIGASSVILPGLNIGNNVYITAGSKVERNLNDFETF